MTNDGEFIRQRFISEIPTFITAASRAFIDTLSFDGGVTESFGLFICYMGEEDYVAVNNKWGQKWRQRFRTSRTACLWLQGHTCLNKFNELCDGSTGEIIYDIAERVRAESEQGK